MGKDRNQSGTFDFVENVVKLFGNEVLPKFHQYVLGMINGVIAGLFDQTLNVVKRKMEIASEHQLGSVARLALQLLNFGLIRFRTKLISVIAMWSGNEVSNAVGRRHLDHLNGHFN